jgi:hypothetical protein
LLDRLDKPRDRQADVEVGEARADDLVLAEAPQVGRQVVPQADPEVVSDHRHGDPQRSEDGVQEGVRVANVDLALA